MQPQDKDITTILQPVCTYIDKAIREELVRQGHIATGALRDSIKVTVRRDATGAIIEGFSKFYGRYVDWGRRPGGKRVPLDVILSWMRIKGITAQGNKERSIAFAIQYTIWKNGIPTSGNKDKTGWITNTLAKESPEIVRMIKQAGIDYFDVVLTNIIRSTKESMI